MAETLFRINNLQASSTVNMAAGVAGLGSEFVNGFVVSSAANEHCGCRNFTKPQTLFPIADLCRHRLAHLWTRHRTPTFPIPKSLFAEMARFTQPQGDSVESWHSPSS
jgi:hypothetical protein